MQMHDVAIAKHRSPARSRSSRGRRRICDGVVGPDGRTAFAVAIIDDMAPDALEERARRAPRGL